MSINSSDLSACTSAINDNQRFLVIPHANVDPDGLSSALACFHMLTALGKDVTVVCPDTKPESLSFLPGFENFTQDLSGNQQFVITVNLDEGVEVDKLRYSVEDHKVNIIIVPKTGAIQSKNITLGAGDQPYDMIIAVDTADLNLFGSAYTDNIDLFSSVPILNIDHHISNTRYGQLHMIDPTASSATEVLYHWFTQVPSFKEHMNADIATLLLTGLITDTRSFQNPNTTPRSLEVAAELLEYGARQQEIIQHVYKTKPLSTLKIWGRALNGIQMDKDVGIVWSSISKEDLAEMEATSKETHGILDELISTIPNADVHVLFTELEEGGLKASMRSSENIDVSALAGKAYGGGGHARAAGFRIAEFSNFPLQVIECITVLKEGMADQRAVVNDPPKNSTPKLPLVEAPKTKTQLKTLTPSPRAPKPKSVDVVGEISNGNKKKGSMDIVEEISKSD